MRLIARRRTKKEGDYAFSFFPSFSPPFHMSAFPFPLVFHFIFEERLNVYLYGWQKRKREKRKEKGGVRYICTQKKERKMEDVQLYVPKEKREKWMKMCSYMCVKEGEGKMCSYMY